jgi:hypothetical protein
MKFLRPLSRSSSRSPRDASDTLLGASRLPDDAPPRHAAGGWHESSLELQRGCVVSEVMDTLPGELWDALAPKRPR